MPKKFYKHKLLCDENMPQRQMFERLNELFDVKHIRDDLNSGGLPDPQVYTLARKLKRLLVTYNIKDFRDLARHNQETGVIGISAGLSPYQIDRKLSALLRRSSEKTLLGKYTSLTSETES